MPANPSRLTLSSDDRVTVPAGFVDAHLDTLAEAAFAGFHSDDVPAFGHQFSGLSAYSQGNWRRAVRAVFRAAEQLRVPTP